MILSLSVNVLLSTSIFRKFNFRSLSFTPTHPILKIILERWWWTLYGKSIEYMQTVLRYYRLAHCWCICIFVVSCQRALTTSHFVVALSYCMYLGSTLSSLVPSLLDLRLLLSVHPITTLSICVVMITWVWPAYCHYSSLNLKICVLLVGVFCMTWIWSYSYGCGSNTLILYNYAAITSNETCKI